MSQAVSIHHSLAPAFCPLPSCTHLLHAGDTQHWPTGNSQSKPGPLYPTWDCTCCSLLCLEHFPSCPLCPNTHTFSLSLPSLQMFVCLENSSSPFKSYPRKPKHTQHRVRISLPRAPCICTFPTKVMTTLCSKQLQVRVFTDHELPVGRDAVQCLCLYLSGQPKVSAHRKPSGNIGHVNECTNEGITPSPQLALVGQRWYRLRDPRVHY